MARYLWQVSYTAEGLKGVLKEGGSARASSITKLTKAMGGKLEAFYFAFGGDDVYLIADLPGNVDAAALALTVGASGAAHVKTVVLLTPEEVDAAAKRKVPYKVPGA
ncbi:MAG TPA: GYD domain-containing protein [Candidatus Dormibacteraeota bacterium]|nr:GYD domain-containing protein [Candidatus Dormibacteraeota bacterium]